MNKRAARKEKALNPKGKPSREEVAQAFQSVAQDITKLRFALAWLSDLIIEKGLYTVEELNAFFSKKQADVQAAMNPPEQPAAQ